MPTNGKKRTFKTRVVSLSVRSNKNGRYVLRTAPVTDVNASGVFQLTENQLNNVAAQYGLNDWKSLSPVIAAGGCELIGSAQFCKAGEQSPDDESIVYTKDWWNVDMTSLYIDLSDSAEKALHQLTIQAAVAREREADTTDRQKASRLRMAIMGGSPEADAEDETPELELEDETP